MRDRSLQYPPCEVAVWTDSSAFECKRFHADLSTLSSHSASVVDLATNQGCESVSECRRRTARISKCARKRPGTAPLRSRLTPSDRCFINVEGKCPDGSPRNHCRSAGAPWSNRACSVRVETRVVSTRENNLMKRRIEASAAASLCYSPMHANRHRHAAAIEPDDVVARVG
jgi:hypothetical protein